MMNLPVGKNFLSTQTSGGSLVNTLRLQFELVTLEMTKSFGKMLLQQKGLHNYQLCIKQSTQLPQAHTCLALMWPKVKGVKTFSVRKCYFFNLGRNFSFQPEISTKFSLVL